MKNCTDPDCHTCRKSAVSAIFSSRLCPDCGMHMTKDGSCLTGCQHGVSQKDRSARQNARARIMSREVSR